MMAYCIENNTSYDTITVALVFMCAPCGDATTPPGLRTTGDPYCKINGMTDDFKVPLTSAGRTGRRRDCQVAGSPSSNVSKGLFCLDVNDRANEMCFGIFVRTYPNNIIPELETMFGAP
jgi:hypothetical protein